MRTRSNWNKVLPFCLGLIAFFAVVGPRAVGPTNIAWLAYEDSAQHYLGWLFYRHASWAFPVGANPGYGLELGTSILFSDSIPLLAIPFKLFSPWLPDAFQYFGLWILSCFALQAWFAWKLVGLRSPENALRLPAAGLFVFAPPLMWRLTSGHQSLAGHFVLLAALYFVFRPVASRHALGWSALLGITALVHPYLLAMILPLWLADLGTRGADRQMSVLAVRNEVFLGAAVVGLACWQAGYLTLGTHVGSWGYGHFRMNVLSVFDPGGWSYVLPDLPNKEGEYEGFNFLGLGVLLLVLCSIPVLFAGGINWASVGKKHRYLLAALGGLTLFAVSNKVGIGTHEVAYPLPQLFLRAANVFRSSGRMFWPVSYALLYAAVCLVVRGYGRRTATTVLTVALIVQIVDTSHGWRDIRARMMTVPAAHWPTGLVDPFWSEAAGKYQKVRWVPPGNLSPHWKALGQYAGSHGLGTDAVYLARVGNAPVSDARRRAYTMLQTGQYERDSLYILDDESLREGFAYVHADRDLLARIDGLNVLAPGWKTCRECRRVDTEIGITDLFPASRSGPCGGP